MGKEEEDKVIKFSYADAVKPIYPSKHKKVKYLLSY